MYLQTASPYDMTIATSGKALNLRDIEPRERHATVFAAFKALDVGDALEIINDHDPDPLFFEFQTRAPGNFAWRYLQTGPLWRVSIGKLGRSHSAGDCCGACGGGA
jgi:uncharacterized protein (DUF2249 family)